MNGFWALTKFVFRTSSDCEMSEQEERALEERFASYDLNRETVEHSDSEELTFLCG